MQWTMFHTHKCTSDMSAIHNSVTEDLLNLIGEDAFTRLCMVFGGTRLHIANSERSLQRLTVVVGSDNARKLMAHYQGESVTLPKLSSHEIAKRHQSIINDLRQGMSEREIAMKYDTTDRNVRRIKAKFFK